MNSDLISREKLLKYIERTIEDSGCENNEREILNCVRYMPAEDAAEVVRCKDCRAFGKSPWGHFRMGWCMIHGCHHAPDYFCASAKEKEKVEVENAER